MAKTSSQTDTSLVLSFKSARRVSAPIVAVETPDAAATITTLSGLLNGNSPILTWDCARGLRSLPGNKAGQQAFSDMGIDPMMTIQPAMALMAIEKLPERSVVFAHNFHRQLEDSTTVQALWNLRDQFKQDWRMVVMLGPSFRIPAELAGDVVVIDEPLPTREQLSETLDEQYKNAELPCPTDPADRQAQLDAVVGLPSFAAEQVIAMSLTRNGADVRQMWARKIKEIEATPGLKVWRTPAPIDDLRGIDNAVGYVKKLIDADAFGAVVFIDEMDKAMAGGMSDHSGDSGVAKDQIGSLLTYIEDTGSIGILLAGVAGTGKSQLAKAAGHASGKPVIVLDLGGMKGGIVGQSEGQIRQALKVVSATAEGRVLFIGTANKTTIFTPEMNRRFPDQFFYDVPDAVGRRAIWDVYIAKHGLTTSQAAIPDGFDRGWTGAEIKRACERAVMFGSTVHDVARYIIPTSVSGRDAIDMMRRQVVGRFLSASQSGLYQLPDEDITQTAQRRSIQVE